MTQYYTYLHTSSGTHAVACFDPNWPTNISTVPHDHYYLLGRWPLDAFLRLSKSYSMSLYIQQIMQSINNMTYKWIFAETAFSSWVLNNLRSHVECRMAVCQLPILSLTISAALHCLSVILKHFISETFPIPNIRVCISCSYLVCLQTKKTEKDISECFKIITLSVAYWLLAVVCSIIMYYVYIMYKKLVSNQNIMGIVI